MWFMRRAPLLVVAAFAGAILCGSAEAHAQAPQGPGPRPRAPSEHGDPEGWRFTIPAGDAARGRAVFEKFECYKCHEVKAEKFPAPSQRDAIGPELSAMGGHHSAGFLAESIVNPNAFIDKKSGYASRNGVSKMPSFNDAMTVQELIDVVAFLKGLGPAGAPSSGRHHH